MLSVWWLWAVPAVHVSSCWMQFLGLWSSRCTMWSFRHIFHVQWSVAQRRRGRADGAIADLSMVLCLAETEDFSVQVQPLWMHGVNAPGNGPASSVAALHRAINGCFRFVSSMCLPYHQLLLGLPSVIFGWCTTSFWACSCSFVDASTPVNSREKKRPFISQCLYNALKI